MIQLFVAFWLVGTAVANPCRIETPQDSKLYSSDFHWDMPFAKMMSLFTSIYESGKRLPQRAYLDANSNRHVLPNHVGQTRPVVMSANLPMVVAGHIEKALARKYADAIIFPDLGHSHFLVPQEKYDREYAPIPVDQMSSLYEKLLADPEALIVYHTAEQLKAKDEPSEHLQWRYYTRNLIGENRPGGEVFVAPATDERGNTLRDYPGYHWWGSGFNVSASKDGCFSYNHNGKKMFFDLSLVDLAPENASAVMDH